MGRWTVEEEAALIELKKKLKFELGTAPQFPELVGDRRLIRFLRGRQNNVDLAAGMYRDHLKWRKEFNVDEIRNKIAFDGLNHPCKFPCGDLIIRLAPQIVINPNACDRIGQPLVMETYNFSVKDVFDAVSIDEYIIYLIHTMEFRSMILETLSDRMERAYLAAHPRVEDRSDVYGVIAKTCVIRDLKGVGVGHMGAKSKVLIQKSLEVATANYQEFLGKSHMINVPWVFNTLWYIIKAWIEPSTLLKVSMSGAEYLPVLQKDIPLTSIPKSLGGTFEAYNEAFDFSEELKAGGALYCPRIGGDVDKEKEKERALGGQVQLHAKDRARDTEEMSGTDDDAGQLAGSTYAGSVRTETPSKHTTSSFFRRRKSDVAAFSPPPRPPAQTPDPSSQGSKSARRSFPTHSLHSPHSDLTVTTPNTYNTPDKRWARRSFTSTASGTPFWTKNLSKTPGSEVPLGADTYKSFSRSSDNGYSNQTRQNGQNGQNGYNLPGDGRGYLNGTGHASVIASLNGEQQVVMTDNEYSAQLRGMKYNMPMRAVDRKGGREGSRSEVGSSSSGGHQPDFRPRDYTPRQRNAFALTREASFGQKNVPVDRHNTQSVVACYNRDGARNTGAEDVIAGLLEKERKLNEYENLNNGKRSGKYSMRIFSRLRNRFSFLFDSLGLLLWDAPLFTFCAMTSFFFFVLLEPFFFFLFVSVLFFFHVLF